MVSGARALLRRTRPYLSTSGTNFALLAIGLASSILASRALGPSARGQYVSWTTWSLTVGVLCTLGAPQAIVTLPGSAHAVTLRSVAPAIGSMLCLASVSTAVVLLVLGAPPEAVVAGTLFSAASAFSGIQIAFQQRRGRMAIGFNAVRVAPQVALLISVTVLALGDSRDPATWMLVVAASQLTAAFLVQAAVIKLEVVAIDSAEESGRHSRSLLRRSLRLAPINGISQLQYRADLLAVSAFCASETTGVYAVASAAQSAVFSVGQSGGMVLFGRRERQGTRSALAWVALVSGSTAGVFWLAAPYVIPALYGRAFAGAVDPVRLLALAAVPQAIDYLLSHRAMALSRTLSMSVVKTLGTALAVGGILLVSDSSNAATLAAAIVLGVYTLVVGVTVLGTLMTRKRDARSRNA